jgi:hypothetical protein
MLLDWVVGKAIDKDRQTMRTIRRYQMDFRPDGSDQTRRLEAAHISATVYRTGQRAACNLATREVQCEIPCGSRTFFWSCRIAVGAKQIGTAGGISQIWPLVLLSVLPRETQQAGGQKRMRSGTRIVRHFEIHGSN